MARFFHSKTQRPGSEREGTPAPNGKVRLAGTAVAGKNRGWVNGGGQSAYAGLSEGKTPGGNATATAPGGGEAAATAAVPEEPRPFLVTVGNIALFFYLISGELNDLSHHFLGANAYISWVSQILLAVALVGSGTGLRAWKSLPGKLWVLLLALMICSIPGSEWPGQSFSSVVNYSLRSLLIYFAVCAFVTDKGTMNTAILGEIVNGLLLLASCVTMGGMAPGGDRFVVVDSYFYNSANDLAVALTVACGFFLYWTVQKNVFKVVLGGTALLSSIYFLMKTGSRGGFLALALMLAVAVIFSAKYRWRLAPILLLSPLLFFVVPGEMLHRLVYIVFDTSTAQVTNADEGASLASQEERTYMFWRSVDLMAEHPLLGVGMDCFIHTVYREDKERNKNTPSLGTHNSYTQIGSECGIPALLVFVSILWISVRRTYRLFRESSDEPGLEAFPAAALCLVSAVTGLGAAIFFFHAAYTPILPILTGLMEGVAQACSHERAVLGLPPAG